MGETTTSVMRDDPQVTVEWEPLLLVSPQGVWLGFADDQWIVGEPGGVVEGTEGDGVIGLLPVLEQDPDAFFVTLGEALGEEGIANFPLERLLIVALQLSSRYWSELAIEWFRYQPPGSEAFQHALEEVVGAQWAPQSVRHAARQRLLRGP